MSHVNKDRLILGLISTLCDVLEYSEAHNASISSLITVLRAQAKENFIGLETAQQLIDRVNEALIEPF